MTLHTSPTRTATDPLYAGGAAYMDGTFMPLGEARIPITDWGYRRSDVVYDVVSVWDGAFFRLDDHLTRFRASMEATRLVPRETDDEIRTMLHRLIALSGLTESYVAMDCLRGTPLPGTARHPKNTRPYLIAFAIPYVRLVSPEIIERGTHAIVASAVRIPDASLDARHKNFHWADMTSGLFEADERGADMPILLDAAGNVTEGPGFNVFVIRDGRVATPDSNVLGGITRLTVIELCAELGLPCDVRPVSAEELRNADEILFSSTSGGPFGVTRIDGRILSNDRPGPLTNRLREAYWAKRKAGWHAEPVRYDLV